MNSDARIAAREKISAFRIYGSLGLIGSNLTEGISIWGPYCSVNKPSFSRSIYLAVHQSFEEVDVIFS